MDDNDPPQRKHPAHPPPIAYGDRPTVIFLTVCVKPNGPVLATPAWQTALTAAWTMADRWRVGLYCLMPDHLHLFCTPGTQPPESLRLWVTFWKTMALRKAGLQASPWQENFWDTQIRDSAHYVEKMSYVRHNPVEKGLANTFEDWPYTGELHAIRW